MKITARTYVYITLDRDEQYVTETREGRRFLVESINAMCGTPYVTVRGPAIKTNGEFAQIRRDAVVNVSDLPEKIRLEVAAALVAVFE